MESSKAPIDPGWNDPPTFSYSKTTEYTKSPKRNFLNKRVAFPLDSSSTKAAVSSFKDPTAAPRNNPNLPPPPTSFLISNSPTVTNTSASDCEQTAPNGDSNICNEKPPHDDTCIDVEEILSMLNIVIEEKRELLSNNSKEEHIKKKLQALKDSWNSNKLSHDIKKEVLKLAKALSEGDKNQANQIQVALMVDYPNVCSEFISAFRQLINAEESTH